MDGVNSLLTHLATNGGAVGTVIVLAYLYVKQLNKELREVENKRIEDNKAMVSKLLELNDKWNETINAQIEVGETQRQLLVDLKTQILISDQRRR